MIAPYYRDQHCTIFCGDCLDVLPQIDSADVVITDPPYSEHVDANSRAGRRDRPGGQVVNFGFAALDPETRVAVSGACARIAKRWVLAFSDVESAHLWREDLETAGLEFVRTGLWIKIGATPQFTGDRPAAAAEAITIAHPIGKKQWNGGGSHAVWSVPIAINRDGKSPRHHPTEKPLEMMTKLVHLFSDTGETILDPFMGSGTTLRAAKDLGRRAIGIEINEKFCEIAAKRLAQECLPIVAP